LAARSFAGGKEIVVWHVRARLIAWPLQMKYLGFRAGNPATRFDQVSEFPQKIAYWRSACVTKRRSCSGAVSIWPELIAGEPRLHAMRPSQDIGAKSFSPTK